MNATLAEFKQAALVNALRRCQLFNGFPTEDLINVAAITVSKPLQKGAYLFHEGHPSRGFYIVQRGAINVHRVNAAGKEQIIQVFRTGESFGEGTLATETGYLGDARAVEASQVLLVQKTGMITLLRQRPELAMRILGSVSAHLWALVSRLEDLTLKDVETRVVDWLVKQCPSPEGSTPATIELTTTKRVLAAELGTVSETFSRTLRKLRAQGIIEVNHKTVTVLCPCRLATFVQEQPQRTSRSAWCEEGTLASKSKTPPQRLASCSNLPQFALA